jgi:glycine rich protein
MRNRLVPAAILAIAAQSLGFVTPAFAATPTNVSFSYTGAEQSWAVPTGVTLIHVNLIGGMGGGGYDLDHGAPGHNVTADLAATPGQTLYIEVGGRGGNGTDGARGSQHGLGGFNGGGDGGLFVGGGGGGASDVRTISRDQAGTLDSRLLVAGGGGGLNNVALDEAAWGGDGTATAGGGGGVSQFTGSYGAAANGQDGSFGQGGAGGGSADSSGTQLAGGNGGGGGWYGGGGGALGDSLDQSVGIGGRGSAYVGDAISPLVLVDSTGAPASVSIWYDSPAGSPGPSPVASADPGSGTVDATVTMAQSAVCLELSASSIDFGTRQFGDVGVAAAPGITVTNCGGVGEDVLAHGSDATGAGPTTWTLDDTGTCAGATLPTDHFGLALERQDTNAQVRLSTVNKALETLSGSAAIDHLARIDTPCPGGSGAGAVMSMQITFVATEAAP